ncbi:putative class II Aldolase/Adducin [Vibrio nigripulchritudo MADA3029]|uniref:class II aldolase/adducin family protein n=1 Tax=Vibrio nigripulchritudo TaxID=28173 RepID=UPI0003B2086B|nr:class II aldolase/adducin family protein [Vibrio nigripulchritudo]CCN47653.1 putative class II Aldolase/Adducin [Vibrio nigripulchritudo MADA3020]CCN56525.1 putative class II Aldolase/Adducin [Vibrio nigripulchritudo MADA3021]CCN58852.1 putative class II Aldolase/Adducin [Vibrio nigripulchritudo MADA3029]
MNIRDEVTKFCSRIGGDPLLVQGAGGNVSWKDGDTLWIKASGTWLAEADKKEIFVSVELSSLTNAFSHGDFTISPIVRGQSNLRPSIETLLHALMPHKIVVHVHAIEVLAHLVKRDCEYTIRTLIGDEVKWKLVDYYKPGSRLAEAVSYLLAEDSIDVVFLKNHGVVIGGDNIDDIISLMNFLNEKMKSPQILSIESSQSPPEIIINENTTYYPVLSRVHELATNPNYYTRLKKDWALYPDHVVFLGSLPFIYENFDDFSKEIRRLEDKLRPDVIFIKDVGVFLRENINKAQLQQLRCYYEVLTRLKSEEILSTLSDIEVIDLVSWDAEEYRKSIGK